MLRNFRERRHGVSVHRSSLACLLIFCFLAPVISSAASFDCQRAAVPVEKWICADSHLSELDEQLAKSYQDALRTSKDPARLKQQQVEWLKTVRNRCDDGICLTDAMIRRMAALRGEPPGPEVVKSIGVPEMHALDLKYLRELVQTHTVTEIATDLAKNDPKRDHAQAFCEAQVKALQSNDPAITVPAPSQIFRGPHADDELANFRIDPSTPDGRLAQHCEGLKSSQTLDKTLLIPPSPAMIHEVFGHPGSNQYNTVIFSRSEKTVYELLSISGFYAYYSQRHQCGGWIGNVEGGPLPGDSSNGVAVSRMAITDVYRWHTEDVYYQSVVSPYEPTNPYSPGFQESRRTPTDDVRLLLYQPQYFDTPRGWTADPDFAERSERYINNYSCRIELSTRD